MSSNAFGFLSPEVVLGALASYLYVPGQYLARNWFPGQNVPTRVVNVEFRRPKAHGLAKPAIPGEVSPVISAGGLKRRQYRTGVFREKTVYSEEELLEIREPGTLSGVRSADSIIAEDIVWMVGRMDDRAEDLCWGAMRGSIVVNEGGVNYTITYPLPSWMTPTFAKAWNVSSPAPTPLTDIANVVNLTRRTGFTFPALYLNETTMNVALHIDQFVTLFNNTTQNFFDGQTREIVRGMLTVEMLNQLMKRYVMWSPQFVPWEGGYRVEARMVNQLTATGSSIVIDDDGVFAAGDVVTLEGYDDDSLERATIQSISGRTLTFTGGVTNTYKPGSTVWIDKTYIRDGEIFAKPEPRPGANESVLPMGMMLFSPHPYGEGYGLLNPATGPQIEVQPHDRQDPPRHEVISACAMMASLTRIGVHVYATAY